MLRHYASPGKTPTERTSGGRKLYNNVMRNIKLEIPILLRYILAASLAGNLLAFAVGLNVIESRGGIAYLRAAWLHNNSARVDAEFIIRQSQFVMLSVPEGSRPIVFLGDSLTAECEWREMFGNNALILNRGIGGDTSAGVLKRAASVAALQPAAVFLMIGTNDALKLDYRPDDTIQKDRAIVQTILQGSPGTKIYLESILPTRNPKFNRWSGNVNDGIRGLADGNTVAYLDIRAAFVDDGALNSNFTEDGIHLNGAGYQCWKRQLDPIVEPLIQTQQGLPSR